MVSTWSLSLLRSLNFYFSQRSQRSKQSWRLYGNQALESRKNYIYPHFAAPLKPGFHVIATIAAIIEPFFFLSDHSDHNDHMETRLYRWRFFLLILEKWMIHRFRPSQKVWTKFRQNLHQSYFVCLFFVLIQSIQAQTKGTQKLFIQENSEDCQAQPKQKTAFIKPNWRRNTKSKAF